MEGNTNALVRLVRGACAGGGVAGGGRMRFTLREIEYMCQITDATPEVRERLILLWHDDVTYGGAARLLGVKPGCLREMVYDFRRRLLAAVNAPKEPPPPPSPDEFSSPREYARFLLRQIERPGMGKAGGNIAPPEYGDRDRVRGRRLTEEDVEKVVAALARAAGRE